MNDDGWTDEAPRPPSDEDTSAASSTDLYRELGGTSGIAALVDRLYLAVLANPHLAAHFAHVSLDDLKRHQRDFLSRIFDGPDAYNGRDLRSAHAGRGLTDADFDRMMQHFTDILAYTGVSRNARLTAAARLQSLRGDVVQ